MTMALRSGARCSGALLQALSASNPLPVLAGHSTLAGVLQRHSAMSSGTSRLFSDLAKPRDEDVVEYKGPFGAAVGRVKKLSLFSCACALAAGPVIFGLDASSTLTAKASIAGTLATFGVFTTGLLQWFTGPYVQHLTWDPDTDTVEVTTLNLIAKPQTQRFHVAEAQPADTVHPLSSFKARGKLYYLDADNFPSKELLARLAPQQAAAQAVLEADEQREQQKNP